MLVLRPLLSILVAAAAPDEPATDDGIDPRSTLQGLVRDALDRSRYRQHGVIYGQYVREIACLVEALESVVRTDRGRAGELLQGQQMLQQARRLQTGAQSQARRVDVRLRRLVGDGLPGVQGLSTVLLKVEALAALVADVDRSTEIGRLSALLTSTSAQARSETAGDRPQLSWAFTGAGTTAVGSNPDTPGRGRGGDFSLGVAVNIPPSGPGWALASDAALRESVQQRHVALQQWKQRARRGLFELMGNEAEHYRLRVAYIDALHDGQQLNAMLLSLGRGVQHRLR